MSYPMRHPMTGFTLIELVVTMIIVGILAFSVLPRLDLLRGWDEIGYRDRVRATLEYARKAAVAQRRTVCIGIVGGAVTVTIASDVPEGASGGTCDRNLTLPGGGGHQFSAPSGVALTPDTTLTFDAAGRPSASATLTVAGAGSITVEAETGYVH